MNLINNSMVPYVAAAAVAGITALAIVANKYCKSSRTPDEETIQRLADEIVGQNLTIADADAYEFVATHKAYVDEHKSKQANLSMMAAGLRARGAGASYKDSPEQIVRLGRDLITKKAGQCDHMAASVIAKIVDHIQKRGSWNSDVELVGNGGHAFVIMNRAGELSNPSSWGKKAVLIDTWLGKLGVHPNYKRDVSAGRNGVITKPSEIEQNANFFGASRFKVTHKFTSAELRSLAETMLAE